MSAPATQTFDYRQQRVYKRVDDDWYVEPRWCVDLLLEAERFVGSVWDPACGGGNIVDACKARGMHADGSDIVQRAASFYPYDFLTGEGIEPFGGPPDNIITNPPYRQARAFIERALSIARFKVAVLVQQQFPFSQGRYDLFTERPLARLYFLSTRPSMPPGAALDAGEVKASGGKTDYLWMVFDHDHRGPATVDWLRRAA